MERKSPDQLNHCFVLASSLLINAAISFSRRVQHFSTCCKQVCVSVTCSGMLALPAIIVQSADFNAFVETLNAYKELGFENPSWYFFWYPVLCHGLVIRDLSNTRKHILQQTESGMHWGR